MKQAVIVSGGRADTEFCKDYMRRHPADVAIAVDSGLCFFKEAGILPDIAVGDFDSVDQETLSFFEAQPGIFWIRLIPEKDDTDTEAAVRRAIADGCGRIHLLGGTGSRLDHVLGNIQLLGIGLKEGAEILLVDQKNRIRMLDRGLTLLKEEQFGSFVSLIPFTPKVTGVTLTGMKYPLTEYTLECFCSIGVSNEIVEEEARISFREGILLALETRD